MHTTTFGKFLYKKRQDDAINAGVSLVQRKAKTQKVEVECLLINVTGLTPESINDIAQASVSAVESAKDERNE